MKSNIETTNIDKLTILNKRGITPKYVEDNGIIVINQKCIRDQIVSLEQSRLTSKDKKIPEEKKLQNFDVLVNSTGVGTLGRVAQIRKLQVPMTVDSHVTILRPNKELVDPIYFGYLVKNKQKNIEALAEGSTGQTELSRVLLGQIKLLYHTDLKEQKKIAHILSTLDKKIELNRKMNEMLENMAQAIFKSWFVDFEPVHAKAKCKSEAEFEAAAKELGISKEVLELFPSEFEESELGMVPKGWEVKRFEDIVEKYIDNRGKTPPTVEKGIPLLEVKNMPDDILTPYPNVSKYVTEEIYNTWFRSHLKENDILISTVGTIGKTCIAPKKAKIAIAQNVLGLRFDHYTVNNQFMYYQMKSKRFLHAIDARLVVTVQASIKRKDLNTIDVLIPPKPIQESFLQIIKPIIEKQQSLENSILQKTRDTLLPKLLSGELDVSEVVIE